MIKRVQAAFEVFAPLRLAGSWDNVGVLLEAPIPNPSARKIFLTIDLTQKVLSEVLQDEEIGVIISYHPVLFSSFKRITMENEKQRLALICAAKGISIFSPHTALDSCNDGINDWLARGLGKGETRAIKIYSNPPPGQDGCGEGRIHTLAESTNLDEICQRIKKHLNLKYLRRAISDQSAAGKDGIHSIKTIAICAGSGASILNGISADLYLTGEMSHHDVLAATASGSHVLLTEHSNSERGFLEAILRPKLEQILNSEEDISKIQVVCSKTDADPLQPFSFWRKKAMPDTKRIEREIRLCKNDQDTSVTVEPIDDNLCHLHGTFKGPIDTCYEGGTFVVDIVIPDEYPFKPPKMKFLTTIYHPNVSSQTGAICLDILKDAWTPVLTLKTALISLQSLLCDPAPEDPQDAQVARHYLSDRAGFEATAREWTSRFANGVVEVDPEAGLDKDAIQRLAEMGFERAKVVKALRDASGSEGNAVDLLLA